MPRGWHLCLGVGLLSLIVVVVMGSKQAFAQGDAKKGQYIAKAAGCIGCHTDTKPGAVLFAGRRAIDTPFGIFYGPNITPHQKNGLGTWSEEDFRRAMRMGRRRDGSHYYPAFPYASFTRMADADIRDLWAYLRSLPPASDANRTHDLRFPFGWRFLVMFWKWLFFTPGPPLASAPMGMTATRGGYLVHALGHCGECHTPRNFLGGPKVNRLLAGADLPEGRSPNLTPTRLQRWSDQDLKKYLQTGWSPEGDMAADSMNEVIMNTTSQWTAADLGAVVAYLRSVPLVADQR